MNPLNPKTLSPSAYDPPRVHQALVLGTARGGEMVSSKKKP